MKDQLRLYVSHPIRGRKGDKATHDDMMENRKHALLVGELLDAYILDWERMDGFPHIELYIPAAHDEFIERAINKQYLNIDQVLDIDCEIVGTCDMLIVVGGYISSGMQIEIDYALQHNIPVFTFGRKYFEKNGSQLYLDKHLVRDLKSVLKIMVT